MNDLTLPVAQDYFTARELAEIARERGLTSFPLTKSAVVRRASREGWNDLPAPLARRRAGQAGGGGMEYHRSILPEVMQALIAGRAVRAAAPAALAARDEAGRRQLAALGTQGLRARGRKVMEARAAILIAIEGHAISKGQTRAWGVARFLEAQTAFTDRQDIEARRNAGEILTAQEMGSLVRPLALTAADGFDLAPGILAEANDRKRGRKVSRSTIYEWFKARDERGVAALAPLPPKEVQPIPPAFSEFLKFYAVPSKPSAADAHGEYLKAFEEGRGVRHAPVTLHQIRRILRKRMNNIERHVGREGLLTLRSRMAYVTRTTEDMWPTTIYTADGHTFDAEVADPATQRPIRPEITTILDVVTRKVVGFSLARSENQRAVAEALRNSCMDHGIPAIFYVDRGPGYRNEAMDADVSGLMGRLGITKSHAKPYHSWSKGRIERPQATIWVTLARRLPTYIGADMDKEAGQAIHKVTRREIAEFGQSRHLPSWEEFVRLCEAAVSEYNDRPHRGLPRFADPATGQMRHMSPNECWAAHVAGGFEPVPVDPDEADDLFRPYEIRTCRRALVQWNGNQYFHEDLEAWHEKKVMVGYDYARADRVWVREFDVTTGQPGRLIAVATFMGNAERYVPLSFEQKAVEGRATARLKRVAKKIDAIEAERDAIQLIEHQEAEPAPFLGLAEPETAALPGETATEPPAARPPRRRVFASDEELAAWALEHPDDLLPTQIEVLRRCLSRPIAREGLRVAGIDTEALRTLLRAAAA